MPALHAETTIVKLKVEDKVKKEQQQYSSLQ